MYVLFVRPTFICNIDVIKMTKNTIKFMIKSYFYLSLINRQDMSYFNDRVSSSSLLWRSPLYYLPSLLLVPCDL